MARLRKTELALAAALALTTSLAAAQTPPLGSATRPSSATAAAKPEPPPRDIKLVEKKWEELSHQQPSADGRKALDIDRAKWKHAETENFILHFRRVTEAQKVAREVEYNLWFVATTLGATKDRYQRKSHVYIFENAAEWKEFLEASSQPMKWAVSYAHGDELFLNVRGGAAGGGGSFDSVTLAHETTHAVVARLYPRTRWPLWLNEGFAEYMGGASVAARKNQSVKRHQTRLRMADMPLSKLESLTTYPGNEDEVGQLYQSSEKFIRFLLNELPKERFLSFLDAVLGGKGMQDAVMEVYGDKFKDWADFAKKYERFTR